MTAVQILPSHLARALARHAPMTRLRQVRSIFFVGETLAPEVARHAWEVFGEKTQLWNVYGPTETIAASAYRLQVEDLTAERIPIGTAIPFRTIHILNENLESCPPGVEGEIVIETGDLCGTYLGPTAEGAQRFLQPTECAALRKSAFRTGDRGAANKSGALEFRGRLDLQIKVHGIRFELEEIEAIIRQRLRVVAGVVFRESADGGARLDAFVEGELAIEASDARRALMDYLPVAVIPLTFTTLPQLPRLTNGKLDRHTLTELRPAPVAHSSDAICLTPHGQIVWSAWTALIGRAPRSAQEDFFAIGGHSLLAMQLVNAVAEAGHCRLRLPEFLWDPTPERLLKMMMQEEP